MLLVPVAVLSVCEGNASGQPSLPTTGQGAIVVFGDSLTSGPGLPKSRTYPALLQQRVRDNGYKFLVINRGVAGDTSTRALRRFDKALVADARVLVLALGINDGLRGIPIATVERNLTNMIERAQARHIAVLLCAMEAPPINGFQYTVEFHRMFARLAERYRLPLVPFFLFQVAGDPKLNLTDGVHPNAAGHELIADAIWPYLKTILQAFQDTPNLSNRN
jgi:acyl-CoA thioesterase I